MATLMMVFVNDFGKSRRSGGAGNGGEIMGGYGSGRWGTSKPGARTLVESCHALDMKFLVREGVVGPDVDHAASWEWLDRDAKAVIASIRVEVRTGTDSGTARLLYSVSRNGVREVQDYPIPLETTTIGTRGRRWWFRCVASRAGGPECRRRARVLYLPPRGRVFACRSCHGLAYQSSRESSKASGMFGILGAGLGLSGKQAKQILEGRFRVVRRLMDERRQRGTIVGVGVAPGESPAGPDQADRAGRGGGGQVRDTTPSNLASEGESS